MASKLWSEKELKILKDMYPSHGLSEQLKELLPDRNPRAISLKASRIGLEWKNNPRKKRSHKEYLDLIKNASVEPLEEYKGSTVLINHRCKTCSHVWKARPQHFITCDTAKCPICSNKARFNSKEDVSALLEERGFTQLSPYKGSVHPILLRHNYCGHEWETKYTYIQSGSGCPECNKGFGYIVGKELEVMEAHLYLFDIITFPNGDLYSKVGVTVRDPIKRMKDIRSELGDSIFLIRNKLTITGTGHQVLRLESKLLTALKDQSVSYSGPKFSGHTEIVPFTTSEQLLSIVTNEGFSYDNISIPGRKSKAAEPFSVRLA